MTQTNNSTAPHSEAPHSEAPHSEAPHSEAPHSEADLPGACIAEVLSHKAVADTRCIPYVMSADGSSLQMLAHPHTQHVFHGESTQLTTGLHYLPSHSPSTYSIQPTYVDPARTHSLNTEFTGRASTHPTTGLSYSLKPCHPVTLPAHSPHSLQSTYDHPACALPLTLCSCLCRLSGVIQIYPSGVIYILSTHPAHSPRGTHE
jgi:hypothetical protein